MIELLIDVNFNHGLVKKGTKLPKEEAKKLLKDWYKEINEEVMTIKEETKVVEDTVKEISKKKKKRKK